MAKPTASPWVVARDILISVFDVAGAWLYFCFLYYWSGVTFRDSDKKAQYVLLVYVVLTFSVLGSILSLWAIATSLGRLCRYKSLCCKCTVPRLSMSLIPLSHVPHFILTSCIDLTFTGEVSWAGWLNIVTSMLALINTLSVTKCGVYCAGKDSGDVEISTLAAAENGQTTSYKQMPGAAA